MHRFVLYLLLVAVSSFCFMNTAVHAGESHHHAHDHDAEPPRHVVLELHEGHVSGEGEHRYTLDLERTLALSIESDPVANLRAQWGLHGGFAVNRRPGHPGEGEAYLFVPQRGVYRVAPDLLSKELLISSEDLGRGTNIHNISIFYDDQDNAFLSLPADNRAAVFIYTTEGQLVHKLTEPQHNAYYRDGGRFAPTDTEFVDGKLYITTGYSPGDYIITADPFTGEWLPDFFGGKGDGDGQFRTAHGITLHPQDHLLAISDRENNRGQRFSPQGDLQEIFPLSHRPCDIDYHPHDPRLAVMAGLAGQILILRNHEVVAALKPREEIKIPLAYHIHNAAFVVIENQTFILAQSWNPGMLFVLKPAGGLKTD